MTPDPIICDYCDQPATRVEENGTTPLCPGCARDHYGVTWRQDTRTLGMRARKAIADAN